TLSGMLRDALLSKANERDFTGFSDDVLARIAEYRTRRSGGFLPWVRRHLAAAILSVLVPAFVALAVVVYLFAAEGEQAPLEVSAEDSTATIINTSDGPVVLFGDAEPEGS
ncbi:MAG TPA: zf-HC2 domain-containing protein, partial [Anaeromyxobacteraceae bacterium]|nr:zf-HC2 domain-containing protein [Anaeromyxobacteraceae bacterium]